jgi:hypothetical protein
MYILNAFILVEVLFSFNSSVFAQKKLIALQGINLFCYGFAGALDPNFIGEMNNQRAMLVNQTRALSAPFFAY